MRTAPVDSGLTPGQRAVPHVMLGGFAQAVRVDLDRVVPLPEPLSFVESGRREFWSTIAGLCTRTARALADLVERGMRPLIGATYPLAEGARALQDLVSRTARGKLVLEVG